LRNGEDGGCWTPLPQDIQSLGRVGVADLIVACVHWSAASLTGSVL
jgi:hypothetical protein